MRLQVNKRTITIISIFLIIFTSTSFLCKNYFREVINLGICFCSIVLVLLMNKQTEIDRKLWNNFMLIIVLTFSLCLLHNDDIKSMVYSILSMFVMFLFVCEVPLETFREYYCKIMVFVSAFGIIAFIVYLVAPSIIYLFPSLTNTAGYSAYNLIFAVIYPSSKLPRLYGFCWEPGAFQTLVNFAIVMTIFRNDENKSRNLFILYTALLLTGSTTGYVVGIICFCLFLLRDYNGTLNRSLKFVILAVSVITVVFLIYPYLPTEINGISFGLKKISRFLEGTSTTQSHDSASVRFDSVYYPLQLFFSHPILGGGYSGLRELTDNMVHRMLTCTAINYFAVYGILYGSIIVSGWYGFCRKITKYRLQAYLALAAFLIAIFSEQYMDYPIMNLFILYGLSNRGIYDE